MKILVLNNMIPFKNGAADHLGSSLARNLRRYGHDAELMRIPFAWNHDERLYDDMLACRMMRVDNVDCVIGLRFPAYLIPHSRKTLWLIHEYQPAYTSASSVTPSVSRPELDQNLQRTIAAADRECFSQTDEIFVISQVVQERLVRSNGYQGEVLHPPLDDAEIFAPQADSDYIFCGGSINRASRQHLLIEAMRHTTSGINLFIAGPPDTAADAQRLEKLIEQYGLSDRIRVEFGDHDRQRLARWVNHSCACAYIPHQEEYGYPTLEAFYAGKPVITTEDAGGVLDFVSDRSTGRVVMPEATCLAAAIDEMAENPFERRQWGEAARTHIHERNISWPEIVKRLVA